MVNEEQIPMRFIGWSVERLDGSSSFGIFNSRAAADGCCDGLRSHGNDVHVVPASVPDEFEILRRERDQLRAALTELTAASLDARIIDTVRCNRWHAAVNKSEQILRGETE